MFASERASQPDSSQIIWVPRASTSFSTPRFGWEIPPPGASAGACSALASPTYRRTLCRRNRPSRSNGRFAAMARRARRPLFTICRVHGAGQTQNRMGPRSHAVPPTMIAPRTPPVKDSASESYDAAPSWHWRRPLGRRSWRPVVARRPELMRRAQRNKPRLSDDRDGCAAGASLTMMGSRTIPCAPGTGLAQTRAVRQREQVNAVARHDHQRATGKRAHHVVVPRPKGADAAKTSCLPAHTRSVNGKRSRLVRR